MQVVVLGSGSKGNCLLVRCGESSTLVDAGLGPRTLRERLSEARLGPRAIDHVIVTHGHLDHSRSAGTTARREDATVHCAPSLHSHRGVLRAPRLGTLSIGGETRLLARGEELCVRAVRIPHDCDPTVALRLEHQGRALVVLTDMGRPDREVARHLGSAHVLVLEFNHDERLLRAGPYTEALKARILGDAGHLSNDQAAQQLRLMHSPDLHTLVLAHLSEHNNRPDLALTLARETLADLGRSDVRVVLAEQGRISDPIAV